jgi:rubrerythrin
MDAIDRAARAAPDESPDPGARWSIGELGLESVNPELASADDGLACLLCASSFIESGSALYTANLREHFAGDEPIVRWLDERWERDELRHGRALRAYLARAWPGFEWQRAFDAFFAEYAGMCSPESLEDSRALEMAARCVVEMGTSSLYRSISSAAREPVLKRLAWEIAQDETLHYKNFLAFFKRRNADEKQGRAAVFGALARRVWELRADDAECALRHVFDWRHPEWSAAERRAAHRRVNAVARSGLPVKLSAQMLLKPLELPPSAERVALPALVGVARVAAFAF